MTDALRPCYVRIATDAILHGYASSGLIRFDSVPVIVMSAQTTVAELKTMLAFDLGATADKLRLWRFEKRVNETYRPIIPLLAQQEAQSMEQLFPAFVNNSNFIDLYLEHCGNMQELVPLTSDDILLFIKYFQPERFGFRVVGSIIVNKNRIIETLFPQICDMVGLPNNTPLRVIEEVRPNIAHPLNHKHGVSQAGLVRGDIIVFQNARDEMRVELHYQQLAQRVCIHLHSLDCPELEIGTMEMRWDMTFQSAIEAIAETLNIHATHIELTGEKLDPNHSGPRHKPFKSGKVNSLKEMIGTKNKLYVSMSKQSMIAGLETEVALLRSILHDHGIIIPSMLQSYSSIMGNLIPTAGISQ